MLTLFGGVFRGNFASLASCCQALGLPGSVRSSVGTPTTDAREAVIQGQRQDSLVTAIVAAASPSLADHLQSRPTLVQKLARWLDSNRKAFS